MSEKQVLTTISATATRAGLSTSAFYRKPHEWQNKTLAERADDCDLWAGDIDTRIRALILQRDALIVTGVAIRQEIAGGAS